MAPNTIAVYQHFVATLIEEFGRRLVCDIDEHEIAALQRKRLAEGKSARTVNFEINTLRQILKTHRLWASLADRVKQLRERKDVGRAISSEDEERLLSAINKSRSPALLPLFVLSEIQACARAKFAALPPGRSADLEERRYPSGRLDRPQKQNRRGNRPREDGTTITSPGHGSV